MMHEANIQKRHIRLILKRCSCVLLLAVLSIPLHGLADVPVEVEPTAEEDQWVDAFLQAYSESKPDGDLIDQHRLIRVALKPFQLDQSQLKQFDAVPVGEQLIQGIINNAPGDSMLTFLRIRERDGQRFAVFHLRSDDGLTYYEWYLDKYPGGKVKAWDCEVYVSGERMTQTLRRLWTPAVAGIDENTRKHMGKRNRELADNISKLTQIRQAHVAQDYQQMIKVYESMPQSVQEERSVMSIVMTAYISTGDEKKYETMLEQYNAMHRAASNRELMMIDLCIYREDFGEAMKMIDGLDRRVGGDHYLDALRSNIAYMAGGYKKATAFIDRGIQNDPRIEDFYWTSIEQAISEKDWPRVSLMLDGLVSIDVPLNDLSEVPYFAGYVESGEYAAWLKRQAEQPANDAK